MKISEDKKTITLKVPLGATVYRYDTRCGDLCMYEERSDAFVMDCKENADCHTAPGKVYPFTHTIENIKEVDEAFGVTVFGTATEAFLEMERKCRERIEKLRSLGIAIDDNGYFKERSDG